VIGQALGHYRVVAKIGAGGMGVVYRAHDEVLHRDGGSKVHRKNRNAKSAKHAKKTACTSVSRLILSYPQFFWMVSGYPLDAVA
jgi:serine/threonine protein kinase